MHAIILTCILAAYMLLCKKYVKAMNGLSDVSFAFQREWAGAIHLCIDIQAFSRELPFEITVGRDG